MAAQRLHARAFAEIHLAALAEHGVDQPRVDAQQLAKALGHLFITGKVLAFAPHAPTRVQRGQQKLLVQVFQDAGDARAQVVVEQDGAGVKVFQPQAGFVADHRLQGHHIAVGQLDGGVLFDLRVDRANAHIQARHVEDARQLRHIAQIKGVAGVVLGDQQQVARFGADFLNRGHRRLHRQGQHFGREVVPAAGVEVGVHGRQLETRIAHIHRGVERRRVLHPLHAKPALDGGHGVEDALLELVDGASERGDEVRNHGVAYRYESVG